MISTIYKFLLPLLIISYSCTKQKTFDKEMNQIIIPVKIIRYDFKHETSLSSSLTLDEAKIYFKRINEIWQQANIKFVIHSFDTIKINDEFFLTNNYLNLSNRVFRFELENLSEEHIETNSMTNHGILTVVIIKRFPHPAGGVWSNRTEIVFFAERAISNILAHEFGHSLSLKHVDPYQYPKNLMKSGDNKPYTAEILMENQIKQARNRALFILKQ